MKAIVLTCDRYKTLADHMLKTYEKIWPTNPFCFHVPYQKYNAELKGKYGDKVKLIKTEYIKYSHNLNDIKKTVLKLISGIPEEEWIYWSIDDRYLIQIYDENKVNMICKWISKIKDISVCGISLNRFSNLLKKEYLYIENIIKDDTGNIYIQRRNYNKIWNPQFLRVKALKYIFNNFPDRPFMAKEMDYFINHLELPEDHKLYVSEQNYFVVGESATRGGLTKNCIDSLSKYGYKIPTYFKRSSRTMIQGEIIN